MLQALGDSEEEAQEDTAAEVPISADLEPDPPSDLLINAAKGTNTTPLPPGDIQRVMSKNSKRSAYNTCIEYKVSYHKEHHGISPFLIDRGANGGVAGSDVRVIFKTNRTVDIQGIDNHRCTNIAIGTVGASFRHIKDLLLVFFINMPFLIEDPPFTHCVNSNGTDMTSMINLFLSQGVCNESKH
jgi:hypothetical protein